MARRDDATGSLFPEAEPPSRGTDAPAADGPLADRMRPRDLDEVVGQDEAFGPGTPLRRALEADVLPSLILWGPPGSGKTTFAQVVRRRTRAHFDSMSAVLSGVKDLREVLRAAGERRRAAGRRTVLFIDEIHRFNKAQQDALLAHVESGDVVLIGATTENPSFEVNAALLSRCRLVVLKALEEDDLRRILDRATGDAERGLGAAGVAFDDDALAFLARVADGDARTALNVLELAARASEGGRVDQDAMRAAFARKALAYDKSGDQHYDLISALHKSVRNSDADAGLYWLARMLEAGEEPLYVARRLVRFASEDVGLADPRALEQAVAAWQAVHFIGMPEGALALAQLVVYLAAAPKSNATYRAYGEASREALASRAEPPPLWVRNAPTRVMKDLGYGRGYRYAHDEEDGVAGMDCLPDALTGRRWFRPTDRGEEAALGERLEAARRIRLARLGRDEDAES